VKNIGTALRDASSTIIGIENALTGIELALNLNWEHPTRVAVGIGATTVHLDSPAAFLLLRSALEAQKHSLEDKLDEAKKELQQKLATEQPKP